uniref:Uncharacterized protein n=1 Tax=Strigamia maritima TaxID=126957 RepID=T1JIL5_STRMM
MKALTSTRLSWLPFRSSTCSALNWLKVASGIWRMRLLRTDSSSSELMPRKMPAEMALMRLWLMVSTLRLLRLLRPDVGTARSMLSSRESTWRLSNPSKVDETAEGGRSRRDVEQVVATEVDEIERGQVKQRVRLDGPNAVGSEQEQAEVGGGRQRRDLGEQVVGQIEKLERVEVGQRLVVVDLGYVVVGQEKGFETVQAAKSGLVDAPDEIAAQIQYVQVVQLVVVGKRQKFFYSLIRFPCRLSSCSDEIELTDVISLENVVFETFDLISRQIQEAQLSQPTQLVGREDGVQLVPQQVVVQTEIDQGVLESLEHLFGEAEQMVLRKIQNLQRHLAGGEQLRPQALVAHSLLRERYERKTVRQHGHFAAEDDVVAIDVQRHVRLDEALAREIGRIEEDRARAGPSGRPRRLRAQQDEQSDEQSDAHQHSACNELQ